MKFEKISDNKIRCTLTGSDLSSRHIKLSELAYGSDQARHLFQEMMQEASVEVGFDFSNSPLMIEAIPVSHDSIELIITKVEDPEELDTRFSRFTRQAGDGAPKDTNRYSGADDVLDLCYKIFDAKKKAEETDAEEEPARSDAGKTPVRPAAQPGDLVRILTFDSLDNVIAAAKSLNGCYDGQNTLVRTPDNTCALLLHGSGVRPELFNKVCNILSEYVSRTAPKAASEAFLLEHGEIIVRSKALQVLGNL